MTEKLTKKTQMKLLVQLFLWIAIGALGYLLFNSIYGEVQFNNVKEERYIAAIKNMRDIRVSQLAHKTVTGKYTSTYDSLVRFIDTAEFAIIERRDTTVLDAEKTRRYGVDSYKELVIVDTLNFVPVKDSLFGKTDRYKTMKNIPIEGVTGEFDMNAGFIERSNNKIPVFEIKVSKEKLLFDQPRDFVIKEKQIISVDGVNGTDLVIGSMTSVNTNSNFPKSFGADD